MDDTKVSKSSSHVSQGTCAVDDETAVPDDLFIRLLLCGARTKQRHGHVPAPDAPDRKIIMPGVKYHASDSLQNIGSLNVRTAPSALPCGQCGQMREDNMVHEDKVVKCTSCPVLSEITTDIGDDPLTYQLQKRSCSAPPRAPKLRSLQCGQRGPEDDLSPMPPKFLPLIQDDSEPFPILFSEVELDE
jgi:hypothetical protein